MVRPGDHCYPLFFLFHYTLCLAAPSLPSLLITHLPLPFPFSSLHIRGTSQPIPLFSLPPSCSWSSNLVATISSSYRPPNGLCFSFPVCCVPRRHSQLIDSIVNSKDAEVSPSSLSHCIQARTRETERKRHGRIAAHTKSPPLRTAVVWAGADIEPVGIGNARRTRYQGETDHTGEIRPLARLLDISSSPDLDSITPIRSRLDRSAFQLRSPPPKRTRSVSLVRPPTSRPTAAWLANKL
ncbi:hypothetical protein LX36DRAFT_463804 [Colletotrichum falcatum]|nr:hypothetical protein LX36DRAFT_463804 [Colletotrichum falcatum]